MSGVVVIALQESFVVRARSNDGNVLDGRSERQHTVVAQQDDRLGDSLTRQYTLLRSLEHLVGSSCVNIGVLEEPKLEFEVEHAPHSRVNDIEWHAPSLDLVCEWLAITVHQGQFHIESSQQSEPGS